MNGNWIFLNRTWIFIESRSSRLIPRGVASGVVVVVGMLQLPVFGRLVGRLQTASGVCRTTDLWRTAVSDFGTPTSFCMK